MVNRDVEDLKPVNCESEMDRNFLRIHKKQRNYVSNPWGGYLPVTFDFRDKHEQKEKSVTGYDISSIESKEDFEFIRRVHRKAR